MPNVSIPLTSFAGGEWSPRLHGRVDIEKYGVSCEVLKNMILYTHGGATRRPGLEYIEDAKSNSVRLIPFEYNREQAYVLEFGSSYIRFFRNGGQVTSGGIPVEVATAYTSAEIWDISFCQLNDVLYLAHPNHYPRKLERTGPDTFTITTLTLTEAAPADKKLGWSAGNYPRVVTFNNNRLIFAGSNNKPQTIWYSAVSNFTNFDFSITTSDAAYNISILSPQNNAIQWITPAQSLLTGTTGGEYAVTSSQNTALSTTSQRQSNFGSTSGRTQLIGNEVIYVSRDGKKLRGMTYSYESESFKSPELSLFSEHLTRPGIKEYDFQQNPDGVLWIVMRDGTFAGMTYLKDHAVQGWHRHETDGDVRSVCVIEGAEQSEVWMAVFRNDATRIERMMPVFQESNPDSLQCAYLDSFLSAEFFEPTDELSGLDHLEGKEVHVLGDGLWLESRIVEDGSITLSRPCYKVVVGLPYEWEITPLRPEGGSPKGFSQGKNKTINDITVRFENSAGVNHRIYGQDKSALIPSRKIGDTLGDPISLFSGDKNIKMFNGWNNEGQISLFGSSPFPATILMISSQVTVND